MRSTQCLLAALAFGSQLHVSAASAQEALDVIASDARTFYNSPNNGAYTNIASIVLRHSDHTYWLSFLEVISKQFDNPNATPRYVKLGFPATHVKLGEIFGSMPIVYWDDHGRVGQCAFNGNIVLTCNERLPLPPN